jgi:hypothetical protein
VEVAPRTEVVLANSVVSFDGRVLELFGHASRTGNRIHVALITGITDAGDTIVISTRGAIDYSIALSGIDTAARSELENLVEQVKQVAPGLQS